MDLSMKQPGMAAFMLLFFHLLYQKTGEYRLHKMTLYTCWIEVSEFILI